MFVAAVVLTVPLVGVSATSEYDALIASIAETRGFNFTPEQLEAAKVAEVSFTLPAGVTSFTATMNWVTNEIVVNAGGAPDNGAQSACLATSAAPVDVGWASTPTGAGDANAGCTYQSHQSGINSQTLVCAGGSFCYVDGLNLGGFFDFVVFQCFPITGAAADSIDWVTGTQTTGLCDGFNFAFLANPPDYTVYDSLVVGDGVVNYGGNN